MRPSQAIDTIASVIKYNEEVARRGGSIQERIRIGIEGEPGIGKSSIARAGARKAGYRMKTFIAAMKDPTDLSGGMFQKNERYAGFLRPEFLPEGDAREVFFIDELAQAEIPMINACGSLILDLKAGDHELSPYTTVIAAWNPVTSRAGSRQLPTQVTGRMTIIGLTVTKQDFTDYARENGIADDVTYFIDFAGEKVLHDFDPRRAVNATPRQWEGVSNLLKLNLPYDVESEMIAGTVGINHGAAFNGFRKLRSEIGNVREVLTNPTGATVSERREVQYATLLMLSQIVDRKTFGNAMQYVARIPAKELEVFFVKGLLAKDKNAEAPQYYANHPAYVAWLEAGNVRFL